MQQSGVKAAKEGLLVIHGGVALQLHAGLHGLQHGGLPLRHGLGLGAEEQHVLHQAFGIGGLPLGQAAIDHQHPRGHALGIHIGLEQLVRQGIKKARADFPENTLRPRLMVLAQAQAHHAQAGSGNRVGGFNHLQHRRIQHAAHPGVVGHGLGLLGQLWLAQATLYGPQVGGVNFVFLPIQGLHIAVLGEEGDGQNIAASEHCLQVFQQGVAGFFQGLHHSVAAILGGLHIVLNGRLHGLGQQSCLGLGHHL